MRLRESSLVVLLMSCLTVAVLYPQVRHLGSVARGSPDPIFSTWRIAWIAHQLPRDPLHLYDANIFFPEKRTLAYSDAMPLTGAAAAPFIWLGASPVLVYNLFVLASFVLAGTFMYLFVRSVLGRSLPAVVSAVAFAFYPFRFEHYIHLELLSAFWMPLVLWALNRTVTHGRLRDGLLTGAALAAQYLSGVYFGMFLACYLVPVGGVLALGWGRVRSSVRPLLAGAALATALIVPASVPYFQVRQTLGERPASEVEQFSAVPRDYLVPYAEDVAYAPVAGTSRLDGETQLFPGFLIVLLACLAMWPPLGTVRTAYLLGFVLAFEMSLGSHGYLQPFLYHWVTPFRGLRVPARCSMLGGLSLAILAGYGASRLGARLTSPRARVALAAVLCAILLFESRPTLWVQRVPAPHPVYQWFTGRPPAAVVEFPEYFPAGERYMYFSTFHWQRLANGYSGNIPESYRTLHRAMAHFPDDASVRLLWYRSIDYLVVHEEFYGSALYADVVERMKRWPSLQEVSRADDGRFEARIYRVVR